MTSFLIAALAVSNPAFAGSPSHRPTLIGVINQALPTASPPDGTPAFSCEATWDLPISGGGAVHVAPGCPMEAEVQAAAEQWRFGYRRAEDGVDTLHLSAEFAYGPDDHGLVGWFYRMGSAPQAGGQSSSAGGARVRTHVTPHFPASVRKDSAPSVRCDVHFVIDGDGVPRQVDVYGCPEPYQMSVLDAAEQWRFYPDERAPAAMTDFTLKVEFKVR